MSWSVRVQLLLGALDLDVQLQGNSAPVAIVGPNGTGKTTLLRTIAGAHRPHAGRISVGDRVLFDSERGIDLMPEARRVGYVPQGYALFPHLNAVDNVAFGAPKGQRSARHARRQAALDLLDQLDCRHLAERMPLELSGGEQQRVALARALMIEPDILLLDEPLSALDASARRAMRGYLAEHLRTQQRPAIVVAHDAKDVVALGADVCVLEGGRVVQRGTPSELRAAPASDFVAELFGVDSELG